MQRDKREENIPIFHQFDFKVHQAVRTKVLKEKASSLPLGGNELPLFLKALGNRFNSASSSFSGISKGMKGNRNTLDNKVDKPCLALLCKVFKSLCSLLVIATAFSCALSSGLLLVLYTPLGRLGECEQIQCLLPKEGQTGRQIYFLSAVMQ